MARLISLVWPSCASACGQFQRRSQRKERILRQRHAHAVLRRGAATSAQNSRPHPSAPSRPPCLPVSVYTTAFGRRSRVRQDLPPKSRRCSFSRLSPIATAEAVAFRAACVRLRDGAFAAAREHHPIRQRHAERIFARAHKIQRISAVFVGLRRAYAQSVRPPRSTSSIVAPDTAAFLPVIDAVVLGCPARPCRRLCRPQPRPRPDPGCFRR